MSKVKNLTKETFNPDDFTYVDLGLPSRRLWATENAPGYYTYDEAKEVFGRSLPKAAALVELWEECSWTWDDKKKGMTVTGPNGNSIFLPASGYRSSRVVAWTMLAAAATTGLTRRTRRPTPAI